MAQEVEKRRQGGTGLTGKQEGAKRGAGPFDWLRQEVDHIFDEFYHHQQRSLFDWPMLSFSRMPRVDLEDQGDSFRLTAELPGFEARNVILEIKDGSLHLAAHREEMKEEQKAGMLMSERQTGSIERLVPLPQAVDIAAAKAALRHGVLIVTLPKLVEATAEAQNIPVETDTRAG